MLYFVEIKDDQITGKGCGTCRTEDQIEVSEAIYEALTSLPATYTYMADGDEIVHVIPIEKDGPSAAERRKTEYATRKCVLWEGALLTIDEANALHAAYLAEGDTAKAAAISEAIAPAKAAIRAEDPNEESEVTA